MREPCRKRSRLRAWEALRAKSRRSPSVWPQRSWSTRNTKPNPDPKENPHVAIRHRRSNHPNYGSQTGRGLITLRIKIHSYSARPKKAKKITAPMNPRTHHQHEEDI